MPTLTKPVSTPSARPSSRSGGARDRPIATRGTTGAVIVPGSATCRRRRRRRRARPSASRAGPARRIPPPKDRLTRTVGSLVLHPRGFGQRAASQSACRQPGPMRPDGAAGNTRGPRARRCARRPGRSRRWRRRRDRSSCAVPGHDDAEGGAEPRERRELGPRAHAAGEHEQVASSWLPSAVRSRSKRRPPSVVGAELDGLGPAVGEDRDARAAQGRAQHLTAAAIEVAGHRVRAVVHDGHLGARMRRGQGEFEPEHARAEHDDAAPLATASSTRSASARSRRAVMPAGSRSSRATRCRAYI